MSAASYLVAADADRLLRRAEAVERAYQRATRNDVERAKRAEREDAAAEREAITAVRRKPAVLVSRGTNEPELPEGSVPGGMVCSSRLP